MVSGGFQQEKMSFEVNLNRLLGVKLEVFTVSASHGNLKSGRREKKQDIAHFQQNKLAAMDE